MEDKWRNLDFIGCNNFEVSDTGKVRCVSTGNIQGFTDNHGYYRVTIGSSLYHRQKHFLVHRLVAMAFIPNHHNKPCVHHKDHDRHNNNVSNLEWVTHHENNSEPETAKRNADSRKGPRPSVAGNNNPSFGKKWMNNGVKNIYVTPPEDELYLKQGWNYGMIKRRST